MIDPRGPNPYGRPGYEGPADPFPEPETDAGVDAILRDDALLDALARGELPAAYRADVIARTLTTWRDDLDEGLAPLRAADVPAPILLPTARTEQPSAGDSTDVLPLLADPDRIDESMRSAFVAAGYARPTEQLPPVRSGDEPTQQFDASFDALPAVERDIPPAAAPGNRRYRRRRLDRVVVATAAVAAVLAAGSAGSVAAAATAHPGDRLWPISRVVYAERARSIEASEDAHDSLEKAREAMRRGDTDAARRYYDEAQDKLEGQVREGSDEADRLAEDLESTAALPDFRAQPGESWYTADPDASRNGGSTTNPSARSRWQRDPRGGTSTQPTPPTSGPVTVPTPTTGAPTDPGPGPGPTSGAPDPEPSTQAPEPTPSEPANTPDPEPSETSSSGTGSPDSEAPAEQNTVDPAPATE